MLFFSFYSSYTADIWSQLGVEQQNVNLAEDTVTMIGREIKMAVQRDKAVAKDSLMNTLIKLMVLSTSEYQAASPEEKDELNEQARIIAERVAEQVINGIESMSDLEVGTLIAAGQELEARQGAAVPRGVVQGGRGPAMGVASQRPAMSRQPQSVRYSGKDRPGQFYVNPKTGQRTRYTGREERGPGGQVLGRRR
jgi:hypothetical protein